MDALGIAYDSNEAVSLKTTSDSVEVSIILLLASYPVLFWIPHQRSLVHTDYEREKNVSERLQY